MSFKDEMRVALDTFIVESRELLQQMEEALLGLEQAEEVAEAIDAIFRTVHTIKGSAGLFGLTHIVEFTHVVESVLDALRDGRIEVSAELIATLLPCHDHIGLLIEAVAAGGDADEGPQLAAGTALLARLQPLVSGVIQAVTPAEQGTTRIDTSGGPLRSGNWHLSLRFAEECLRNGMDPFSFIRYLATLGDIIHLTTLTDRLPSVTAIDPECCYLGFEIDFHSGASKEEIESVFEFVLDGSTVRILPPDSQVSDYIELIRSLPEEEARLGEILVKSGILTQRELDEGLRLQQQSSAAGTPHQPIGAILVEQQMVQQPVVEAVLERQQQIKEKKAREAQSIRVDAERLDRLIDLVGELVIAGAGANLRASVVADAALNEATAEVMRLVEAVRDSALQLRMVPIGTTFSRFQRVVRDVSSELGKEIELVIRGADTELDRSVVEKIGDPLTHLVRNAMDHGIESTERRLAAGKPARGRLMLNACHDAGSVVIEVGDDGGGLNRDRILAKAIDRGIVAPNANLSDHDIHQLIFAAGFSTADQVSNLSGRGVGMDVVKRNIEALRGTVELESVPGEGTTVRIRLPLTLAIIDGFLVGVGDAAYVVPLGMVLECVELAEADRQALTHRRYVNLRGEVLPFVRLRDHFEIGGNPGRRENIVVVQYGGQKAGVVVDRLMGEFQTVIKPLGKIFSRLKGISGSTILGSGDVALILDVPALIQQAVVREAGITGASPDDAPHRVLAAG